MKQELFLRTAALCGFIFPILAFIIIFLFGSFIPGYSPIENIISEIWKNGSEFENTAVPFFVIFGATFFIFSIGVYTTTKKNKYSYLNLILFATFSLCLAFLGIFTCQDKCTQLLTFHSLLNIHFSLSMVAIFSLGFSPLIFYFVTKKDKNWKDDNKINLVIFFSALAILFILFINLLFSKNYHGFFQRLYFFILFIWVEFISIKLFKLAKIKTDNKKR